MKKRFTEFVLDGRPSRKPTARTSLRRKKMGTTDHIFTLGIEEEFQIIDPETRELCSQSQRNYGPV
jgi:hypothetical protein